jgi:hypothetical protein
MSLNLYNAGLYASVCGLEWLDRIMSVDIVNMVYHTKMQFLNPDESEKPSTQDRLYTLGSLIKVRGSDNIYMITKFIYDEESFENSYYEVRLVQKVDAGEVKKTIIVTDAVLVPERLMGIRGDNGIIGKNFFNQYGNALLFNIVNGVITYRKNEITNFTNDFFLQENFKTFIVKVILETANVLLDNSRSVKERIQFVDQSIAAFFEVTYDPIEDDELFEKAKNLFDKKQIRSSSEKIKIDFNEYNAKNLITYVFEKYDFAQLPLLPSIFQFQYNDESVSTVFNLLEEFCDLFDLPYNDTLNSINFATNFFNNPIAGEYLQNVTGLSVEEIQSIKPFVGSNFATAIMGGSKTKRNRKQKRKTQKIMQMQSGGNKYALLLGFVFLILTTLTLESQLVVAQAVGDQSEVCFKLACLFQNVVNDDPFLSLKMKTGILPSGEPLTAIQPTLAEAKTAVQALGKDELLVFLQNILFNLQPSSNAELQNKITKILNMVSLFNANANLQPAFKLFLLYDLKNSEVNDTPSRVFQLTKEDANSLLPIVNSFRDNSNNNCIKPFTSQNGIVSLCPSTLANLKSVLQSPIADDESDGVPNDVKELRNDMRSLTVADQEKLFYDLFINKSETYPEGSIANKIVTSFKTNKNILRTNPSPYDAQLFTFVYKDLLGEENRLYLPKVSIENINSINEIVKNFIAFHRDLAPAPEKKTVSGEQNDSNNIDPNKPPDTQTNNNKPPDTQTNNNKPPEKQTSWFSVILKYFKKGAIGAVGIATIYYSLIPLLCAGYNFTKRKIDQKKIEIKAEGVQEFLNLNQNLDQRRVYDNRPRGNPLVKKNL